MTRSLFSLSLFVVVLGLAVGCEDNHIGRICELGVQVDGGTANATINSQALECPSRICLLPAVAGNSPMGTGPLCTAGCSSDDDCSPSEGGKNPTNGPQCKSGFGCGWPTTVGPLCCQRMCICRDFAIEPGPAFTQPEACKSPNNGGPSPPICANVK
jgi:hypothetical protein